MSSTPRPGAAALCALILGLVVLLPGWGRRDLWDPDEARYAWVAEDMAARGEWLEPELNGNDYTSKPPPFFWLVAGARALTGDVTTAAPLVSILAGAVTAALVAGIGARLASPRVGLMAAGVFVSAFQVSYTLRRGMIDPVLTCFASAAVLLVLAARDHAGARRGALQAAAALCAGVGFVFKGPAALVGPLLVAGALAWPTLREALRGGEPGRALALLGRGAALSLPALAAPLALGAAIALHDGAGQALATGAPAVAHPLGMIDKQEPFWFYAANIPADALPWTLLLPAAVLAGRATQGGRLALLWVGLGLAIYSAFPAKRPVYLLPLYVPIAVLVAMALDAPRDRLARTGAGLLLGAMAVLGVAGPAVVTLALFGPRPAVDDLRAAWLEAARPAFGPAVTAVSLLLGAILVAVSVTGLVAWRRRDERRTGPLAVASTLVATVWIGLVALPLENARRSSRPLAEFIGAAAGRGERVVCAGAWRPSLNLYSGLREIPSYGDPADVARELDAGAALVVVRDKAMWQVPEFARGRPYRVEASFAQKEWMRVLRFAPAAPGQGSNP